MAPHRPLRPALWEFGHGRILAKPRPFVRLVRWWCRYICPGGGLYSLLGRFRLVRVRRDEKKCTECGDCARACQFGLRPMFVKTTGMECTNCAMCISACDSDALHYSFVLPVIPSGLVKKQKSTDKLLEKTKTAVLGLCLCLLLLPTAVHAHHILGLPHYSYKENYPQVPTLEYPATSGPYDILGVIRK